MANKEKKWGLYYKHESVYNHSAYWIAQGHASAPFWIDYPEKLLGEYVSKKEAISVKRELVCELEPNKEYKDVSDYIRKRYYVKRLPE